MLLQKRWEKIILSPVMRLSNQRKIAISSLEHGSCPKLCFPCFLVMLWFQCECIFLHSRRNFQQCHRLAMHGKLALLTNAPSTNVQSTAALIPPKTPEGFFFQEAQPFVSFLYQKCFKANRTVNDSPPNNYFLLFFSLSPTWEDWGKKTHHVSHPTQTILWFYHLCNKREGKANAVHLFCSGRISLFSFAYMLPKPTWKVSLSKYWRFCCFELRIYHL